LPRWRVPREVCRQAVPADESEVSTPSRDSLRSGDDFDPLVEAALAASLLESCSRTSRWLEPSMRIYFGWSATRWVGSPSAVYARR